MPKRVTLFLAFLFLGGTLEAAFFGGLTGLEYLKEGRRQRSSSADPNWRNGNADCRPIAPGESITVAELQGPGKITHMWFTISAEDPYYGRSVTLRIWWDGNKEPAVECPLGDFFAVGHGLSSDVNSLPVQVSSQGRAYNCWWPMPFKKSAKVTVSNDSTKYRVRALYWYIDWVKLPALPDNVAYFHAQYRQEFPCRPGRDYLILDAQGRGHYVGTVLSVQMNSPSWFGEGDDRFYIDGEREPSLKGTGTEDYFCDAWGFRRFNRPFYGVTIWEGFDTDDHGTAYRWHIPDPIPFERSLRVTIEHKGVIFHPLLVRSRKILPIKVFSQTKPLKEREGAVYVYTFDGSVIKSGFGERFDNFSSVAFWYQTGRAKRFATLPPAEERLVLGKTIEAEGLFKKLPPGLEVQKGAAWSGGAQLFFHPSPKEKSPVLEIPFSLPHAGRFVLNVYLTKSWDYGVYSIQLDGKRVVGEVDLFSDQLVVIKQKLGVHNLSEGSHLLRFSYVRSNPRSRVRGTDKKGTYLGIDRIVYRALPARSVHVEFPK